MHFTLCMVRLPYLLPLLYNLIQLNDSIDHLVRSCKQDESKSLTLCLIPSLFTVLPMGQYTNASHIQKTIPRQIESKSIQPP